MPSTKMDSKKKHWICDKSGLLKQLADHGYRNQSVIAEELHQRGIYTTLNSASNHLCQALNGIEYLSDTAYQAFGEIVGLEELSRYFMIPPQVVREEVSSKKEELLESYLRGIRNIYDSAPPKIKEIILGGLEKLVSSLG